MALFHQTSLDSKYESCLKLYMNRIKIRLTIFSFLMPIILVEIAMASLVNLLPDEVKGWKKQEDQIYNRETLYEYINGGAELYISYGFKEVLSRKYTKSGQPDILVELFDMDSSTNAYGIFSHSREEIDTTFGQGSQYTFGLMLFWKDQYLVSILASPETEESKQAVFALAQNIDYAIPAKGQIPEIIKLLPQKNLIQESIRYFRHYIWLNSHYYIADKNILNIDESTHAVLAKYLNNGNQSILLLVNYPNNNKATEAYNSFKKHYLPELVNKNIVKMEDGTWTGCRLKDSLLSVVFNTNEEQRVKTLLGLINK